MDECPGPTGHLALRTPHPHHPAAARLSTEPHLGFFNLHFTIDRHTESGTIATSPDIQIAQTIMAEQGDGKSLLLGLPGGE